MKTELKTEHFFAQANGLMHFFRDLIIFLVEADEKKATKLIIKRFTGKKSNARLAVYEILPKEIKIQLGILSKEASNG